MQHFVIKQGDTFPVLQATLFDAEQVNLDLEDVEITFQMGTHKGKTLISRPATYIGNGTVQYEWQAGDTDIAGNFKGEFELKFSTGKRTTVPAEGYIIISIPRQV